MAEMTPKQMRTHIEEAPDPLTGAPIWEQFSDGEGYEMAGRALAKAMLLAATDDPALLDLSEYEDSWDRASNDKLWQAVKDRWEGVNDWLGGVTGFQFGWAHNAVRYIIGVEPTGNPAIATVTTQ